MDIYEPREDSYLLQRYVDELAFGSVLDMGTGSGILALAADADEVVAADINRDALEKLRREHTDIITVHSDLFTNIESSFDVIVFNPPYLPQDEGVEDPALYGGEEGHEVLERFLRGAKDHLKPEGFVLFVCSSLTGFDNVEDVLCDVGYVWERLGSERLHFEKLVVYKAW